VSGGECVGALRVASLALLCGEGALDGRGGGGHQAVAYSCWDYNDAAGFESVERTMGVVFYWKDIRSWGWSL